MGTEDLPALFERLADRLHLGEYEREAYVTVLEHGTIAASDLADRTQIPQPRVYDTVRNLDERGLVEVHESRPMQVIAIDPAEAFAGMTASMETLLDGLRERYTAPTADQAAVSLVNSRTTIVRNLGQIIDEAEYELSLALSPETVAEFESNLEGARSRQVSVELIIAPAAQTPNADAFDYSAVASAVRLRRGRTTPIIAVADGQRAIFATRDAIERAGDRYGVLFNRSALGFLLFGFYGTVLWSTSEPIFETSTEPTMPRQYASVRRCIKDMRSVDGEVYAQIDGRWVEEDQACDITGRIVEATVEDAGQVATLSIDTVDGIVTVGGRLAAYEDVEAHMIRVADEPLD